jgi:hypothetical protein
MRGATHYENAILMELVEPKPNPPSRPPIRMIIAVLLEVSMLATFIVNHSTFGILLWVSYFWFSATLAYFQGPPG